MQPQMQQSCVKNVYYCLFLACFLIGLSLHMCHVLLKICKQVFVLIDQQLYPWLVHLKGGPEHLAWALGSTWPGPWVARV